MLHDFNFYIGFFWENCCSDAYFKNSRTKQNNYWAKEEQDILGEQADRYYLVKIAMRKI